jgi:hypothetical protein
MVEAKNTNAAAGSAATVAPELVSQIDDAPARRIAPNISLRQSRRDALSMMAATAVCSIAAEGIAPSPASADDRDASTAGMSPARLQASQNAANRAPWTALRSRPKHPGSHHRQSRVSANYRCPIPDFRPGTRIRRPARNGKRSWIISPTRLWFRRGKSGIGLASLWSRP